MNTSNRGSNVANTDAPIPLRILVTGDRSFIWEERSQTQLIQRAYT